MDQDKLMQENLKQKPVMQATESAGDPLKARRSGRWKLFAVLLVCAAPMILSYLTYYVIKPTGRTNYGTLIDPRERPDRVERVWLVTDAQPLDTMTIRQYDGMHLLRAPKEVVDKWLPAGQGTQPSDHIYLIDPLGNLMMRFPANPDPSKVHKDIAKLLKASAIG